MDLLPPLPDDVRDALPAVTIAPPWPCDVEAVVWWHLSAPGARAALPAGTRPLLPVTVAALLRYVSSPVGGYREVLACPVLLRGGGLVHTTVPFIAVDSVPSVAAGRAHWALPKVLATFSDEDDDDASGTRIAGEGWSLTARSRPRGPSLPLAARFSTTQDGRRSARSTVRGRARAARVEVAGEGLPVWLRPGRHPGLVLTGGRLVVGAAR